MSTSLFFVWTACFWAPWGHHARLRKDQHIPNPRSHNASNTPRSLCSCADKTLKECFTNFYELHTVTFFGRSSKALGIIQKSPFLTRTSTQKAIKYYCVFGALSDPSENGTPKKQSGKSTLFRFSQETRIPNHNQHAKDNQAVVCF